MCLILFAQHAHPDYALVLAANRDEFYERPAIAAHQWTEGPFLFAGKDLRAGGTWLGINQSGKMAAVTNYRDLRQKRNAIYSRGELVPKVLGDGNPTPFLEQLRHGENYDGFNLLFWDGDRMSCTSNISGKTEHMGSGIHGLSNALINTPWHKVEYGKTLFRKNLELDPEGMLEGLFNLLGDTSEGNELPDTGLPKDLERKVSSIFIKTEFYGTRCSTVVLIGKRGQVYFEERSFVPQARTSMGSWPF